MLLIQKAFSDSFSGLSTKRIVKTTTFRGDQQALIIDNYFKYTFRSFYLRELLNNTI